ncbi:transcription factor GTE4, partial [Trifolium medium]|nr:transcription factor GTE4 [Trifolium medium]
MFRHPCLCKGEAKQIIGVDQVVQAAQAVILGLLQVIPIVTVPQPLDLMEGHKEPEYTA